MYVHENKEFGAAEVAYKDWLAHREDCVKEFGGHPEWNYLLVYHKEPHEFVHQSKKSLFATGIQTRYTEDVTLFGKVIYCMSTECPDISFSEDTDGYIKHYFMSCDWRECVLAKSSPVSIRYCMINQDIPVDELYNVPMLNAATPLSYCRDHLCIPMEEMKSRFPKACASNQLVNLINSWWRWEDTVL